MHEHLQPGRRRPARRHQPPARARALHDHHQRARRRPGRARERPERGRPPRRPGAAGTRQGARASSPARTSCSRNWPWTGDQALAPFAAVREQRRRLHRAEQTRSPGRPPTSAARSRSNLADFPAFLRAAGPGDGTARALRRSDDAGVHRPQSRGAGDQPERSRSSRRSQSSSTAFFTSLGKTAKVSGPALASLQPLLARVKKLGSAAKPFSGNLAELLTSLRDTRRAGAPDGLHLPRRGTTNGYDALGHFLRAEIVANALPGLRDQLRHRACAAQTLQHAGTAATGEQGSRAASATHHEPRDGAHARGPERRDAGAGDREIPGLDLDARARIGAAGAGTAAKAQRPPSRSAARAPAPPTTRPRPKAPSASGMLLNYLLGN